MLSTAKRASCNSQMFSQKERMEGFPNPHPLVEINKIMLFHAGYN